MKVSLVAIADGGLSVVEDNGHAVVEDDGLSVRHQPHELRHYRFFTLTPPDMETLLIKYVST